MHSAAHIVRNIFIHHLQTFNLLDSYIYGRVKCWRRTWHKQDMQLSSAACSSRTSCEKLDTSAGASLNETPQLHQLVLNFLATFFSRYLTEQATVIHLHAPSKCFPYVTWPPEHTWGSPDRGLSAGSVGHCLRNIRPTTITAADNVVDSNSWWTPQSWCGWAAIYVGGVRATFHHVPHSTSRTCRRV